MIFKGFWNHDLAYSFRRSPVTIAAAALTLLCVGGALFAQDQFYWIGYVAVCFMAAALAVVVLSRRQASALAQVSR